MPVNAKFLHYTKGVGRPQIVLVGNGLERKSGQLEWDELLNEITVNSCVSLTNEERKRIPFPLLYVLLSTPIPTAFPLSSEQINLEEKRLKYALNKLNNKSNEFYDQLPSIGADHIFTTNYSYALEKAFWPNVDFSSSKTRLQHRFNLNPEKKNGKPVKEICYRMHSGYCAETTDNEGIVIWHIHGEMSSPRGVVLGHDRYGRLLSRIESVCSKQLYGKDDRISKLRDFCSWPELFLYGDIYIVGFGFWECEFDLWWLLRRKQRERYSDGRVYFYDKDKEFDIRKRLLVSHGVELYEMGDYGKNDYDSFYFDALKDIKNRISHNKIMSN